METITNIKDLTLKSLNEMGLSIAEVVPNVLSAILVLVIGWLITKIIASILKKTLKFIKVDKLTDVINEKNLFGKTDLKFNVTNVIVGFFKWIMFLVFLIIASDIMNWKIVSVEIGNLLRYLPRLFSAIALFMIGLYIANYIKKAVQGLFESFDLNGDKIISNIVFYVIIITITITALNQAGIETDIITNNLTIILGAFLATIVLGFGLGSREIIKSLLFSFYSKKNFEVGQIITLDDIKGEIVSIDNICVSVRVDNGDVVVIPIKDIIETRVTKKAKVLLGKNGITKNLIHKNTIKMRTLIIAVLVFFTLNVTAQKKPKIKGDKDVVTTTHTMEKGFNAIEIDDALEVTLSQNAVNSYVLTTDKNLQDIIQFSVNDSVLKIYTTNKITSSKKLEISLSFVNLEHITLKNYAKIKGEGSFESQIMYINAYNSSKFDLDVKADDVIVTMQRNAGGKLKTSSTNTTIVMTDRTDLKASVIADKTTVTLTKSAQLDLSGDSDMVAFNLKDGTKLDARKMKASSADLYTSNKSDVYVYAGKNLELYAQGKSNIYVYGDPKIEVKGLTDNSKIIKK